MAEAPSIRQQFRVAYDLMDEAGRWSRDEIGLQEFHAAIESAGNSVGGLVQLVDAMTALAGSLTVALAEVTGRPHDEMLRYLRERNESMPGLD